MKKRLMICLLVFTMLLSYPLTCFADELSVFYSDEDQIGYDPVRTLYSRLYDGFTSSEFSTYLSQATTQWSNAGISAYGVDSVADSTIEVYGGTRATLEDIEPDLVNYTALTSLVDYSYVGDHTYSGRTIANYEIMKSIIYSPKHPSYYLFTSSKYKRQFTHELSHALGWLGHSLNSSDVMYSSADSSVYTLTTRDKSHLVQNY
ncbi:MAG: hypothetical protein ACM3TR_20360 [Caulobacteraceae bacterium]